jgi:hypothetical protein
MSSLVNQWIVFGFNEHSTEDPPYIHFAGLYDTEEEAADAMAAIQKKQNTLSFFVKKADGLLILKRDFLETEPSVASC